ncbi:MAG: hypothetical protein C0467_21920 [Planctomycetaceae bacterium]|nr:hypothetical protein [Planctomycetaceae bacterium]
MARHTEGAWFRASKNTWYATVNGKMVSLGIKGGANEKEATKAWHKLMVKLDEPQPMVKAEPKPEPEPKTEIRVKDVLDAFLVAKKGQVKKQTHYVYDCLLNHVRDQFGKVDAVKMKSGDVLRWLYSLSVSASTRSDIGGVLSSSFKWAEVEGLIPSNPLKNMKRPSGESRGAKAVVTEDTHKKLMEAATPALRVLLSLLHETGCRPSELSKLEAHHIDFVNSVAILNDHKTAQHTGKPRLIILNEKAVALLKVQVAKIPSGALLRNAKGRAWTKDGICLAMRRASKKAGVKGIAYGYRHAYATTALIRGVNESTVAALLGHSSTTMLHKHYSHLGARADILREAAGKVR